MSYVVSEVYEVFIAVVTVVLLALLFTAAGRGRGEHSKRRPRLVASRRGRPTGRSKHGWPRRRSERPPSGR